MHVGEMRAVGPERRRQPANPRQPAADVGGFGTPAGSGAGAVGLAPVPGSRPGPYSESPARIGAAAVSAAAVTTASVAPASNRSGYSLGWLTPHQVIDGMASGLSYEAAQDACGPAAAVAFARFSGRYPSVYEATVVAENHGLWDINVGMYGGAAEVALIERLGVPAELRPVDWNAIRREVQRGRPVIIDTSYHYFVAERYDRASGRFDFGNTGAYAREAWARWDIAPVTGGRWLTPAEVAELGGGIQGSIHMV